MTIHPSLYIIEEYTISPTYARGEETSAEDVRERLRKRIEDALSSPSVKALSVSTGAGKTRIAAQVIAEKIKAGTLGTPVIYSVPTHKLGEDIAEQFRHHGLSAEVWRGRDAEMLTGDPMCLDIEAVKLAIEAGESVETACCKGERPDGSPAICAFYGKCGYQRQKRQKPDVWIVAHQALFSLSVAKEPAALVIDERFYDAGLFGLNNARGVSIDDIEHIPLKNLEVAADLAPYREKLGRALRRQNGEGAVPRANLVAEGITIEDCDAAVKTEWRRKHNTPIYPGMPPAERKAARKGNVRQVRDMVRIWHAVRDILAVENPDAKSGRLFIEAIENPHRNLIVRTRGIRPLRSCYENLPTLILDATLPDKVILEKWFPSVEVVDRIELPMPHVTVWQVVNAPVTKRKLQPEGRNLIAIKRYIANAWIEAGRKDGLVITHKDIRELLTDLPEGVAVEHFNAISGIDAYRDVGLLLTIGRTVPGPRIVEEIASALSGVEVTSATTQANGGTWYDCVERGIRLRDGGGVALSCDRHPDELAEAVRQQICEAELIQAIGRGRGVNRTKANPLDVHILANVVLPVDVDCVDEWNPPGPETVMALEGVWLTSPADIAKAWPEVWKNEDAAELWLRKSLKEKHGVFLDASKTPCFPFRIYTLKEKHGVFPADAPPFLLCTRYRPVGTKKRWRHAWHNPRLVLDVGPWLDQRLGEVTIDGFSDLDEDTPSDVVEAITEFTTWRCMAVPTRCAVIRMMGGGKKKSETSETQQPDEPRVLRTTLIFADMPENPEPAGEEPSRAPHPQPNAAAAARNE